MSLFSKALFVDDQRWTLSPAPPGDSLTGLNALLASAETGGELRPQLSEGPPLLVVVDFPARGGGTGFFLGALLSAVRPGALVLRCVAQDRVVATIDDLVLAAPAMSCAEALRLVTSRGLARLFVNSAVGFDAGLLRDLLGLAELTATYSHDLALVCPEPWPLFWDAAWRSPDFDWEAYGAAHIDLAHIVTEGNVRAHWLHYGRAEGREAPPRSSAGIWPAGAAPAAPRPWTEDDDCFPWEDYRDAHGDLAHFASRAEALDHWGRYGRAEGRRRPWTAGDDCFPWEEYRDAHDDLAHLASREEALDHWRRYGSAEGRHLPCRRPIFAWTQADLVFSQHRNCAHWLRANEPPSRARRAAPAVWVSGIPDYDEEGESQDAHDDGPDDGPPLLRLLVIGNLNANKGAVLLRELLEPSGAPRFEVQVAGGLWPAVPGVLAQPYGDLAELDERLRVFRPHALLELTHAPETWNYALSLALRTRLPLFYLRKPDWYVTAARLRDQGRADLHDFEGAGGFYAALEREAPGLRRLRRAVPLSTTTSLRVPLALSRFLSGRCVSALVIVTSHVCTGPAPLSYSRSRSAFSWRQRLDQTLETVSSLRWRLPGCAVALVDASSLPSSWAGELRRAVDVAYLRDDLPDLSENTERCLFKGLGEATVLREALLRLRRDWSFAQLFKISGRYVLNRHFDAARLTRGEANVMKRCAKASAQIGRPYVHTCFYRIGPAGLDGYSAGLDDLVLGAGREELCSPLCAGLEELLYPRVSDATELLSEEETLGVSQRVGPWGTEDDI